MDRGGDDDRDEERRREREHRSIPLHRHDDRFDPAEFDTPAPSLSPTSAPAGDDYRILLDAMRQAGAEGVAQPIADLIKRLEHDARDRARSADQARTDRDQLHAAASRLAMTSQGLTLDRLKEWLAAALISIAVIFAAVWAWRWAEEPKIETHVYGCSTGWDAKKDVCRGKWVPLVETKGGQ
jgi:glutathione S-transferase